MTHQHQAPPSNNPVGSTSINSQYSPHFSQPSPPQHSQQSQSTARSSTPMLMINNPHQFQQGHERQTAPSTASRQATQGSPMVDGAQETGTSPGSSIPCAQKSPADSQPSPASTQGTSIQSNSTQVPQAQ